MTAWIIILFVIVSNIFTIRVKAQDVDTTYITPAELEPGWGLYYTEFDTAYYRMFDVEKTNMPLPKTWELMGFQVSPDGKYLAFTNNSNNTQYYDWFGLKVLNLETKEIITIDKYGWCPMWTSDSKMLFYQPIAGGKGRRYAKIWFPESNKLDTICKLCDTCQGGRYLGPDNNFYFKISENYPNPDSLLYRTNLDSTLKFGCSYNEPIEGTAGFEWYAPLFPPKEITYTLRQFWAPRGPVKGFYLIQNFDAKNGLRKLVQLPDTSWVYSTMNTAQWGWGSMVIGPNGVLYAWLSFRPKSIVGWDGVSGWDVGPFDSVGLAARNASGLYKLDTSGGNLVQLVRSWTYNPGGFDEKNPAISITADGETIYYGFLQPDTCISIMRMNRFGRNKELVYKLDRVTSKNENISLRSKNKILTIQSSSYSNKIKIILENEITEDIKLAIYDIYGKKITDFSIEIISSEISLDASNFASGVYFLIYSSKDYNGSTKFLIIH